MARSVNPISTRRTDCAHLITTGTPGFSDLPTALPDTNKHPRAQGLMKCEMRAYLFFEFGLWLCGSMRTRGRYGLQWLLVIVNLQRICHFAAGGGGVSGGGSYSVSTSSYRSSCSNGTMVKISSKRPNEIWHRQEFEGGKSCLIIALLNVL